MTIDSALVAKLHGEHLASLERDGHLGKVRRYLDGDHDRPYMPKSASKEFAHLADRAVTNWTPLLPDTFSKLCFVDGYRRPKADTDSAPWSYWQANGMDARQTIANRGALAYGTSYVLVLPGDKGSAAPFMRPLSPLKSAAWYEDDDDETPEVALRIKGRTVDGTKLVEVYDAQNVYTFAREKDATDWGSPVTTESHGLGVTPFVRFRERLGERADGIVWPVITLQDRVNEVVFATLIAMQYASFRQRWATGLAIPEDDDGEPMEPFEAAINRLWISDDSEARFGDFAQTDMTGHLSLYASTVKTLAGIAQLSPTLLTGDFDNVSAEALASLQDATLRKGGEFKTLFGESWEQAFRLASKAAGDAASAADTESQVRWRDTGPATLAQNVDALGKLSATLGIPAEALWEKVPGVTDGDLVRWKALKQASPENALVAEVARQTAALNAGANPAPAAPLPAPPAPAQPAA